MKRSKKFVVGLSFVTVAFLGTSVSVAVGDDNDGSRQPDRDVTVFDVGVRRNVKLRQAQLNRLQDDRDAELRAAGDSRPQQYFLEDGRVKSRPLVERRSIVTTPDGLTEEIVVLEAASE